MGKHINNTTAATVADFSVKEFAGNHVNREKKKPINNCCKALTKKISCPMPVAPLKEINIVSTISYSGGVQPRLAKGIFPV